MYTARPPSELGPLPSMLAKDGIAVVPNIYSPDELAEINAALDSHFASRAGEHRAYAWPDDMLALGILNKILSPAMIDVFLSIIPDPVIYHFLSSEIAANMTRPHVSAEVPGGWHRDGDCHYCDGDPTHVSIFTYLSDVGPGDGAFELWPQRPGKPIEDGSPVVSMQGGRGTSFAFHRSFYHRASPNTGPKRRRIIKFSIQRNEFFSAHLKQPYFQRTLAATPQGDPKLDMLLGRFQGKTAPSLAAERLVYPAAAPVNATAKLNAKAPTAYVPRDPAELEPLQAILAEDGVVAFHDIYSVSEMAELNAALNPYFASRSKLAKSYVWADDLLELGLLNKILSPAMIDVLFSIMPDPVLYHFLASEITGGNSRPTSHETQPGGWAGDEDSRYFPGDPTHVSLMVYLSDVGRDGGMIELSPQSPREKLHAQSPVISVPGNAGTSFAWNRSFQYREAPNTSPRRRRVIKISILRNAFVSAFLKQGNASRTLAETPRGDARLDMLLGRHQGKEVLGLAPARPVTPRRLKPLSIYAETVSNTAQNAA